MVALSLTGLLVITAMVLDFGLVRIDRQVDRSVADSATLAGLHGLNTGDGTPHPFVGVCTAVRYLQVNSDRFSGVSTGSGWTDGLGANKGDGCTDATLRNLACKPGDKTSWAKWHWTGTSNGIDLDVTVESGYDFTATGNQWQEDSLAATTGDNGATEYAGCDHLAVTIHQSREPGLGSLATSSDLSTGIRSVGRIKPVPGGDAPAMILLKQTGCGTLTAGASAGGSKVLVKGAVSADGIHTQPGTIHSDSDGSGCGSNENIFTGQATSGIVAYAAPLVSNQAAADPSKPGSITGYAALLGVTGTQLRDSTSNVCGSAGIYGTGSCPGADITGRARVYRKPVDERYLVGVKNVRDAANTIFSQLGTSPPTTLPNFTTIGCNASQADINILNLTAASNAYVYCPSNSAFTQSVTINAGTVVFAGKGVAPNGGPLSLPNATRVYINGPTGGSGDAISLSNNSTFSMHTTSNTTGTPAKCKDTSTNIPNKAVLVVKYRGISQTGGLLQLCYTSVVMMGGQADACMPASPSTAPPNPSTPCGGGTGFGQLTQTGGSVDWTAPNRYTVMNLSDGRPDPAKSGEYQDSAGPEDLAFWSESGGTGSNPKFQMTGGGDVHLVGVLMTPNAQPFNLSGQFVQDLVNAQYITGSIALSSNNTRITMSVDPNAAVTLPDQGLVGLVR
jgi:hypothetical protein